MGGIRGKSICISILIISSIGLVGCGTDKGSGNISVSISEAVKNANVNPIGEEVYIETTTKKNDVKDKSKSKAPLDDDDFILLTKMVLGTELYQLSEDTKGIKKGKSKLGDKEKEELTKSSKELINSAKGIKKDYILREHHERYINDIISFGKLNIEYLNKGLKKDDYIYKRVKSLNNLNTQIDKMM